MAEEQKTKDKGSETIAEPKKVDHKSKAKAPELDAIKIHVKLYLLFKTYCIDSATSVSGENETCPFDISPTTS